jgi:hypothetical protein
MKSCDIFIKAAEKALVNRRVGVAVNSPQVPVWRHQMRIAYHLLLDTFTGISYAVSENRINRQHFPFQT